MPSLRPVLAVTGLSLALGLGLTAPSPAGEGVVTPDPMVFVPSVILPPAPLPRAFAPEASIVAAGNEDEITVVAVRVFTEARSICAQVPDPSYQIDCLADQLEQLARNLPQTPEFAETRSIVQGASERLQQVARSNASTTKRPARLRQASGPSPRSSSRPIRPVATERLPEANAQAATILREAETLLLRASEQSERRKVAFAQVAQAVGSSTILLRST